MTNEEYQKIVDKHTPQPKKLENALTTFFCGGTIGLLSELLLEAYASLFHLPTKEAGILVILTLIIISSILTALGIFDFLVTKLKSALIIPITGFAHSITSSALEYSGEGIVLGIGANIFKLAGTVIVCGIVAVYIFGLIRLLLGGTI